MGTKLDSNMILFMNGKAISQIKDVQITTIESDSESNKTNIDLTKNHDFTATFTPRFPHITRKHFIRNLRKLGCSKKQAKQMAWDVQKKSMSYSYASFLYTIGAFPYCKRDFTLDDIHPTYIAK